MEQTEQISQLDHATCLLKVCDTPYKPLKGKTSYQEEEEVPIDKEAHHKPDYNEVTFFIYHLTEKL